MFPSTLVRPLLIRSLPNAVSFCRVIPESLLDRHACELAGSGAQTHLETQERCIAGVVLICRDAVGCAGPYGAAAVTRYKQVYVHM